MSLTYKKMSLFDAPNGSVLVHACNSKGVWGAGIAKDMKNLFPYSWLMNQAFCLRKSRVGEADLTQDEYHYVASLITSEGYGKDVDDPKEILENTREALEDLCSQLKGQKIYSNKFNSGYFKVPWEETEKVLKEVVEKYKLNWVVCSI